MRMSTRKDKIISNKKGVENLDMKIMSFQWYMNYGKLCLLNNMDIEKSKMSF
jgi:hypothetical protein